MSAVLDPVQASPHRIPDQMGQALLLAVLLHVLLILIVGTAPGGRAKPGEGAWGPINIRLQGDRYEPGSGEPAIVIPDRGPVGDAKQARSGGAVREKPLTPKERKTPGAAHQGQWRQQPGDELTGDAPSDRKAPPAATAPAPAPAPAPPTPAAKTSPAPAAEPTPTPPVDLPPPVPTPTPLTMPSDSAIATPTRIAPAREVQPTRATAPTPEALQAPAPVQLPERPAPMLSETPTTLRRLDRAPVERSTPQPVPSELKAPSELPPLAPAPTPTPAPAPTPPAPTQTQTPTTAPPAATTPAATPSTTTPQPRSAPTPTPTQAPANRVSLDGSTSQSSTQPSVGAPDAGARVGHDVATPASAPPNAPKLNLDLNPARGPMAQRGNGSGVIQALPKPPVDKDALAEEMKKAGQQDCRKAYADKGLLAVVPLARDAMRDKGCRW
ncbi:MAG: hypothetical protein J7598_02710 [Mitsuaria chitosanitabida]|uniref:hypothetical protein n=1 Tax=Roseateles chitosanitabidus TaxID=65048 RepID=UPI001B2C621A|nr:hypothetical protein [Roseateles chitosanitabidus]MBO9685500.1 hypothetical protein [Roseateles chitosanitabidus]